jgi:Carboxypeptidase regulatory-like domain
MRWIVVCLVVGVPSLLSCRSIHHGTGNGSISGTARDQSGAVLPGVEITATQTDTGIARSTITNETGAYILPKPSHRFLSVGIAATPFLGALFRAELCCKSMPIR